MGIFSKFMAPTIFFLVLSLLLISTSTNLGNLQSNEEGYISVVISNKGLDFAEDLLINKAVSSMIPLQVADIEKSVKIPIVGKVHIVLSNITIDRVDIASSNVETGEMGIFLVASGATANLSMNWRYSYSTWLVPITISDKGVASVQVEGMEVGLTVALKDQGGTLKLSLLDCGCYVKDISIKLDGGASWLYQGVVDAFQGKIRSAVEDAISKKIKEGIIKLQSSLQSIPKQIPIDDTATLNVTFVNNPALSKSSIKFEISGLFTAMDDVLVSSYHHKRSQSSVSCYGPAKMVGISVHENVFKSAALVYFNADYMNWVIDKIPDQSLLNTAGWRFIVPQLYNLYPNDDMSLNISVTSPPIIKIAKHDMESTIYSDVTISVLDAGEVIPVACISMVISASCSAEISRNNLAGSIALKDFTMSLKWSKIGNLHMHLVQSLMATILKTVFLPYVNLRLRRGFPLPLLHSFTLRNAEILHTDSNIVICSDIAYTEQHHLGW